MPDLAVVPAAPTPPRPSPPWGPTKGQGRMSIEGADIEGRWHLVQVEALVERLRELGVLA